MSRVLKQGLDYFPLKAGFASDPTVLLIKKEGGDSTVDVLIQTLSFIYGEEGYFVKADQKLYKRLAITLYQTHAEQVERIIRLAVEEELFDSRLFEEQQILTSTAIQQQFLFCARRRKRVEIKTSYCLLSEKQKVECIGKENIKFCTNGDTDDKEQLSDNELDSYICDSSNNQNDVIYPQK
jgi:hypothetical protein